MVLRILIVLALLALPAGAARSGALGGVETAFVAAEDDDMLVVVEGREVVARIPVADGPHNVAVSRARRLVLVTSPPAGQVTLVDSYTRRVLHVFSGFGYPHDAEFGPDERYAYVTDERRGQVAVLDLRARRVVRRVSAGAGPHDLAVSPDGRRVWVTHGPRALSMTILATGRPAAARAIGSVRAAGAHDIAFAPDGSVWVTYWNGLVGKFVNGKLRLRKRIGSLIHHVAAEGSDRIWVTDHEAGSALLLSGRGGRILRTLRGCPGAHHVAVGPARGNVVVACHDSGAMLVLDPVAERLATVEVGRGPHGIAVALTP